jgi:hypothetical protein
MKPQDLDSSHLICIRALSARGRSHVLLCSLLLALFGWGADVAWADEFVCDAPAGKRQDQHRSIPVLVATGQIAWVASRSDQQWAPFAGVYLASGDRQLGVTLTLESSHPGTARVDLYESDAKPPKSIFTSIGSLPLSAAPIAFSLDARTSGELRARLGGLTGSIHSGLFNPDGLGLVCGTGVFKFANVQTTVAAELAASQSASSAAASGTQASFAARVSVRSGGPEPSGAWVPARRLALVIGNSTYSRQGVTGSEWPDLGGGPLRDADGVATRLKELGFEVVEIKDQDLDQMNESLRQLDARIRAAQDTLAVFYYSGHGTQAPRAVGKDGEDNYLIPVRTDLARAVDAHSKAIALQEVRDVLQHSRAGVVILDACRNNALRRESTRTEQTRGLAAPENVTGMLFAYATAVGEVASNRPGQMSEYTELLVKELGKPGESLTTTFRTVRKEIATLGGTRLPELTDELNDDIVLFPQ